MNCPDILPTIANAADSLQSVGIAYLHLAEAYWEDAPTFTEPFRQTIRNHFSGSIIVAGKYDLPRAEWVISNDYADLIAFGRDFVANPDLPRSLEQNLPHASFDGSTRFSGSEIEYSDYPTHGEKIISNTKAYLSQSESLRCKMTGSQISK